MRIRLTVALAILMAALGLAACGDDDGGLDSGGEEEVTTAAAEGEASGTLKVSNWPFYIDRKTIPDFEEATGITVDYTEDVNDNNEFFGKVQPQLEQGEAGGRDIMVVTDWMANKMYDLGYLAEPRPGGCRRPRRRTSSHRSRARASIPTGPIRCHGRPG